VHPYPHLYRVAAAANATGDVLLSAASLPDIASAPPPEFDGPGGRWSPESLLCAAVADCFVLTFRSIARFSKFEWLSLECTTEGTLEKAEGGARFTRFVTRATLRVPAGSDAARARQLLEKAEHGCLIANSLNGARELVAEVVEG
jgi:organic hydroperoxide reductase OsmC/OhrA